MSRSGYSDDCEHLELWRQAVERAIAGKRGQAFLRELVAALDSLADRRLISGALEEQGAVCAIGSVGLARGIEMASLDPSTPAHGRGSRAVRGRATWRWTGGT